MIKNVDFISKCFKFIGHPLLVLRTHYALIAAFTLGIVSKIPVTKWEILQLGRSRVGLPLAVPKEDGKGVRFIYVKDEPRIAVAALLDNGVTVIATHLSFVPFVNLYQLRKLKRWAATLPGEAIILGDLNLPWSLPARYLETPRPLH